MVKKIKTIRIKQPLIEKEYYDSFTIKDPKTGKKIVKKVKIIRYESRDVGPDLDENKDEMVESINSRVKNAKPRVVEEI